MSSYDRGDLVRITATFTAGGVNTDPSAVYLYLRAPDGTLTTLQYGVDAAVVKTSTGVYRYDYSATSKGDVYYRWAGTGAAQAADQGTFFVQDDVGP
jgi:hypothetical protein